MSKLFEQSRVYKPFFYPWAVELTREHEQQHWVEDEISLNDDVTAWKGNKLTPAEKNLTTQILRMFTQADVAVGTYYDDILMPRILNNEVRCMLASFRNRESLHQRAYALLNDTLGLPESDYALFLDYAEMRDKYEFMLAADSSTIQGLAMALAKGVFNEGVSLFASFVILLNFQRRGLMQGMGKIVEWSIKDESKHVEGVSKLFRAVCEQHPGIVTDKFKRAIYDMAREVVQLEDRFIDLAYAAGEVEGLTSVEVKTFMRYITDRRLTQLGLKPNFMVEDNPLTWLDWIINSVRHTNFFEGKVAEYDVAGLQGDWSYPVLETENPPAAKGRFRIYSKDGCPWCLAAKNLLKVLGHEFDVVDLTDDAQRQRFYNTRGLVGPARSMPQIYLYQGAMLDETRRTIIGTFRDLEKYLGVTRSPS